MFQRAMGMLLVVMLERGGQIACRSRCVRRRHEGDVVAIHALHEALGHAVTLRAAHRRGRWLQADGHCEPARVVSCVARTVVARPLFRTGYASRCQPGFPQQPASRRAQCHRYGLPSWPPSSSPHGHSNPARTLRAVARHCRSGTRSRPSTTADCCARRPPCRRVDVGGGARRNRSALHQLERVGQFRGWNYFLGSLDR